jgi:hypothetical protein
MELDPSQPLDPNALSEGGRFLLGLPRMSGIYSIRSIFMHWRVSSYTGDCLDYNALVKLDPTGSRFILSPQTSPLLNACDPLPSGYAAHTWHRNSHAVGISVDAMADATTGNFGQYPVTQHMAEVMCAGVAAYGLAYGIDVSDADHCMTHAEAAILDDYFGERWDWSMFNPGQLTKEVAVATGKILRGRAHAYKVALSS